MDIWDASSISSPGEASLLDLEGSLLARVWPSERVMIGMLVCKAVRSELGLNVEQLELEHYLPRIRARSRSAVIHFHGSDVTKALLQFQNANLQVALRTRWSNEDHYDATMWGLLGAWNQGWRASLVELDVSGLWVLDSGAEQIAAAISNSPRFRFLDINKSHISNIDAIAEALLGAPELEHLDLGQNEIDDGSAEAIGKLVQGKFKLEFLNLGSNLIGERGICSLSFAGCTALTSLSLAGNEVGGKGMQSIADGLRCCGQLVELCLNATELRNEGATALAATLSSLTSLRELGLEHDMIDPEGAKELARALASASLLACLDLSHNRLGDAGVAMIAQGVERCPTLRRVLLANNWVADAGAGAMEKMLGRLGSAAALRIEGGSIDLSANRISPGAGTSLVEAARACSQHLTVLWS